MKTINLTTGADGSIGISVDDQAVRTIYNPENFITKAIEDGAVIKLTDETWRQTIMLEDTLQYAGVEQGPFDNSSDLVDSLNTFLTT